MIKIFVSLFILLLISGCDSEYYDLIKPAYELKLKDPNPNPVFEGEAEPSIPDEDENNKTLLGIDQNKNGIRDDVDIWINRSAKNYNELMALRQAARAYQDYLKVVEQNQTEKAEVTMNAFLRGILCVEVIYFHPNNPNNRFIIETYLKKLLNHPRVRHNRAISFYKYIILVGPGDFGPYEDSYQACTFNLKNKDDVIKNYNTPSSSKKDL
jgi:hypothetical protein